MAIWKNPGLVHVPAFGETWERIGFHDYFEQVNIQGEMLEVDPFAEQMIGL